MDTGLAERNLADRRAGDAKHIVTFVVGALIAAVALAGGAEWLHRALAPAGPPELREVQPNEILFRFKEPSDLSIQQKRTALGRVDSRLANGSDEYVLDLYGRAHQYALDLRDTQRHATTMVVVGIVILAGAAAARVDYRFRDGLLIAVPIYQIAFGSIVLWRMTSPARYWSSNRVVTPVPLSTVWIGLLAGIGGGLLFISLVLVVQDLIAP